MNVMPVGVTFPDPCDNECYSYADWIRVGENLGKFL